MIRRSTWILVGVFLALVGLTWWARENQSRAEATATSEPTATPMPRLLPDLEPEAVVRIVLEAQDADRRVVLVRVEATPTPAPTPAAETSAAAEPQWEVAEPADATPPEAWRVNSALEGMVYARILATLPPDTDPATVGLAQPEKRIVLETRDGQHIVLWVGASTPLQNGYYLRVGDNAQLVAVGQYAVGSLLDLLDEIAPPTTTPTPSPTP